MGTRQKITAELVGDVKFFTVEDKPEGKCFRTTGRSRTTKSSKEPAYEIEFFSPHPENKICARLYVRIPKDMIAQAFMDLVYSYPDKFKPLFMVTTPSAKTLEEILSDYYEKDGRYVLQRQLRNQTFCETDVPVKNKHMKRICEVYGSVTVEELNSLEKQKELCDGIRALGPDGRYSDKSMINILAEISVAFNDYIEQGIIFFNPVPSMKKLVGKEEKNPREAYTLEELYRMFSTPDVWHGRYLSYASALFAFQTGMRIGEVLSLKIEDISIKERSVRIATNLKRSGKIGTTKTNSIRMAPLSDLALTAILPLISEGKRKFIFSEDGTKPITYEGVYRPFRDALTRLGITKTGDDQTKRSSQKCYHGLRFSWYTLLSVKGTISQEILSFIGGHNSETITISVMNRHYVSLNENVLTPVRNELDKLFSKEETDNIKKTAAKIATEYLSGEKSSEKDK